MAKFVESGLDGDCFLYGEEGCRILGFRSGARHVAEDFGDDEDWSVEGRVSVLTYVNLTNKRLCTLINILLIMT